SFTKAKSPGIWKELFEASSTIAQYMAKKFVQGLEEFGRAGIWSEWSETIVEWDRAGGCTSGGDFSDLRDRQRSISDILDVMALADIRAVDHYKPFLQLDGKNRRVKINIDGWSRLTEDACPNSSSKWKGLYLSGCH
ncbi:hypothetical protein BG004_000578, partial [Podila humilis]